MKTPLRSITFAALSRFLAPADALETDLCVEAAACTIAGSAIGAFVAPQCRMEDDT